MDQYHRAVADPAAYPDLRDPRARLFRARQDGWHSHAEEWEGQRPDIASESRRMASRSGMRAITVEVLRSVPGAHTLRLSTDGGLRLLLILDEEGNELEVDPETWDRLRRATADCLDHWTGDPEAEKDFTVVACGDWLVPIHGHYETDPLP